MNNYAEIVREYHELRDKLVEIEARLIKQRPEPFCPFNGGYCTETCQEECWRCEFYNGVS